MIIFDANFLVELSIDNGVHDRVGRFLISLGSKQIVGIPAPAWSEFIYSTDAATLAIIRRIRGNSSVRILPFDEVAAFEAAEIHKEIIAQSTSKKGASDAHWQKIKIDRQVLAIARQHHVTCIYTGDHNMIAEAAMLGIATAQMKDIEFQPAQAPLFSSELEGSLDD